MKDNVSAFCAEEYDEKIKKTLPYYEEFYRQVIDVVKAKFDRPVKWLDVGCGTGKMAEEGWKAVKIDRLLCCDHSPEMVRTSGERFQNKNVEFLTVSLLDMDIEETFDVVTAIQVLHYFKGEERMKAVRKCFEALNAGGIFLTFENFAPYSEAGKKLFLKRWKAYQMQQGRSKEECEKHLQRYGKEYYPVTISEQMDSLKQCGFKDCEIIWVSNMQAGLLGIKGRDYNENTFHRTGKSSV